MSEYISGMRDPGPDDYPVTVVGNLTNDPDLTFAQSGTPYTKFSMAANVPQQGGGGEAQFYTVTSFYGTAENVAESLHKGDRVLVTGNLTWRERDNGDGFFYDITANEVAISLRYGTAHYEKNERKSASKKSANPPKTKTTPRQSSAVVKAANEEEPF